jgi:phytoene dehydrogenase-like protein
MGNSGALFDALVVGGGKAMMNAYYDTASRLGVEIAYESEVGELAIRDGEFLSAAVFRNGASQEIPPGRSSLQPAALRPTFLG